MQNTGTTARSNRKSRFIFATDTTTHFDTVHGGGFGAWVKMVDRTTVALFGAGNDFRLLNADDKTALVFASRGTGEQVVVTVVEVTK